MYCLYCGREMQEIEGTLTCVRGNMPLSHDMQRRLQEKFTDHRSLPAGKEVGDKRGRWYCPECGIPLSDGFCDSCGKSLTSAEIYRLVELHPHLNEEGKWY